MSAMSLQGFLISWMLVGTLQTPADRVGFGRALIELPGLVILLLGGVLADRTDGRRLLIGMHLAIALPSIAIALMISNALLSFWLVIAFGIAVSAMQAVTDPARQSILIRVTRTDIQRSVTIMTIVTSIAGVGGVWLGGHLEKIGLPIILLLQAGCFAHRRRCGASNAADAAGRAPRPARSVGGYQGDVARAVDPQHHRPEFPLLARQCRRLHRRNPVHRQTGLRRRRGVVLDGDGRVHRGQHRFERRVAAIHAAAAPGALVPADATDARGHPRNAVDQPGAVAVLRRHVRLGIQHGRDVDAGADDGAGTCTDHASGADTLGAVGELHGLGAAQLDAARQSDRAVRSVDRADPRDRHVARDLRHRRDVERTLAVRARRVRVPRDPAT